jgi:NhaP-type Na+/H+ or K+/H+ antiporter
MKNLYFYHSIINTIAILCLSVGLFYAISKPDGWFPKHRLSMILFGIILTISVFYALIIREFYDETEKNYIHSILAIIIILLVLLQIFIAIVFRDYNRELFEKFHKINATIIVILLSFQIYFGIDAYKNKTNSI